MSGRAGRRGKDDKGIVIQMLDEKMEPDIAKNMIYGASDPLFSSYHVSYNMVLNMLRVEDANPENLIRTSFHQYQQERNAPALEQQAAELRKEANTIEVPQEEAVREYVTYSDLLLQKQEEISRIATQPAYCLPFLQAGRMVQVTCDRVEWGWGVVVNVRKSAQNKGKKMNIAEQCLIRPAQVSGGSDIRSVPPSLQYSKPLFFATFLAVILFMFNALLLSVNRMPPLVPWRSTSWTCCSK
jgi:superfamily II RNA helicase